MSSTPERGQKWFDELFNTHIQDVVRFLYRRGAGDDAQDLASEVFILAWNKRESIVEEFQGPWLFKTASLCLSNWYRKKRAIPAGDAIADWSPSVEDPGSTVPVSEELNWALNQLSPRDREIILVHAYEGLVGEQLANYLGVSRSGADAALSRARSRLATLLEVSNQVGAKNG